MAGLTVGAFWLFSLLSFLCLEVSVERCKPSHFSVTKLECSLTCQGQDKSALKIFLRAESIFRLTLDSSAHYAHSFDLFVKIRASAHIVKSTKTSKSGQRKLKNLQKKSQLNPQLPPSRLLRQQLPSSSWLFKSSVAGTSTSRAWLRRTT